MIATGMAKITPTLLRAMPKPIESNLTLKPIQKPIPKKEIEMIIPKFIQEAGMNREREEKGRK